LWDRLKAFGAQVSLFVMEPWRIPAALLGSVERDSEPEPEPEAANADLPRVREADVGP
jgi:hypothetical protein